MDWHEVLDLLKKADGHFNLRLTLENGSIYFLIDGEKTEIRRSDFNVLRPMTPDERNRLDKQEQNIGKLQQRTALKLH